MRKLHIGVLILTLLILGGLVGYSLVQNGHVPVALVNGDVIWLNEVKENAVLSRQLYQAGIVGESGEYAALFSSGATSSELVRRVLESLIGGSIMRTQAPAAVRDKAERRVAESLATASVERLQGSVQELYGWDVDTFAERILHPQALQEALIATYNDEYDTWIREAHTSASVRVWFLPYEWQDGSLVDKLR